MQPMTVEKAPPPPPPVEQVASEVGASDKKRLNISRSKDLGVGRLNLRRASDVGVNVSQ